MDSILVSIKKLLGVDEFCDHFDEEIIMDINSVIMILTQLGVGPAEGFFITDSSETWTDLCGDRKDLQAVKTYVYQKVKLVFDPPSSSALIEALNRSIAEFEWRLNHVYETTKPKGEEDSQNG